MFKEIWKDINGYDGYYQVSNVGRIKRLQRDTLVRHPTKPYYRHLQELILSPNSDKDGYLTITLSANGMEKNVRIHRLVGVAFLENHNGYDQINHKDGNKRNNNVSNLEWCDCKYNQLHAWKTGLKKTLKIAQISSCGNNIINIFNSLNDIKKMYKGVDLSTIVKVCKGKRNTHYGFKWIYANDNMKIGDIVNN